VHVLAHGVDHAGRQFTLLRLTPPESDVALDDRHRFPPLALVSWSGSIATNVASDRGTVSGLSDTCSRMFLALRRKEGRLGPPHPFATTPRRGRRTQPRRAGEAPARPYVRRKGPALPPAIAGFGLGRGLPDYEGMVSDRRPDPDLARSDQIPAIRECTIDDDLVVGSRQVRHPEGRGITDSADADGR